MKPTSQTETPANTMLRTVAYLTIITVGIGVLQNMAPDLPKWPVGGLFGMIMIVQFFFLRNDRFWYQVLYLALFTILASSFFFFNTNPGLYLILYFVISAQAMMILPTRYGLMWIALLAIFSSLAYVVYAGLEEGLVTMLVYSGGYLFFGSFGRLLFQSEGEKQKTQVLLQELEIAHQQLQAYVEKAEELAVAEERNRLAREMHDTLGHFLTTTSVQLEGAQRLVNNDPDKAVHMIQLAHQQVRDALEEVRRAVTVLRQPVEAGLSIHQSLERLTRTFEEATQLPITLSLPPTDMTLPETHRLMIYRIVQEALTNVQRHASASRIWVTLQEQADRLQLQVRDNGVGIPPDAITQGFGLRGIQERAHQLGGEFQIIKQNNGGSQLTIIIPVVEELTQDE